jgi:hypothetical protein
MAMVKKSIAFASVCILHLKLIFCSLLFCFLNFHFKNHEVCTHAGKQRIYRNLDFPFATSEKMASLTHKYVT